MATIRSRVIHLYKNGLLTDHAFPGGRGHILLGAGSCACQTLLPLNKNIGRDYPKGYDYFRVRLKEAFMKNKNVTDSAQIEILLTRGQYIIKELEALYMLKKYRTLKKRYYSEQ